MAKRPENYMTMSYEDQALWDYINAGNEFNDGGAAEYENGLPVEYSQLNPQDLTRVQNSAYGDITTDPSLVNAEQDALSSLEERVKGTGLSLQDEADISRLQGQTNQRNRGRQGAIQQEMQARGMSGSGMDLVARMQASQDSTEMDAYAALEKAAQAQTGQRDAADRLGNRATAMRGQQFNEQAQKAQAQDNIARFNAQNQVQQQQMNWQAQNQATQQNWNRANQTSDRNTASNYDFRKDKMGVQKDNSQTAYNKAADDYNRSQAKKGQKGNRGSNMASGAASGATAGAAFGPWGAVAGGVIGAAANYAQGGKIPGESPFPGDNEMNDIFTAQLSPGEVVIPRSIAHDPVASAKFVAQQNAMDGGDPMASRYVAQGAAQQEPRAPFYPTPDGKPIPSKSASMPPKPTRDLRRHKEDSPQPSTLPEPALQALAAKNPGLVERYRTKMLEANQGVDAAKEQQGFFDKVGAVGKGVTDIANSQQSGAVLKNRMQDLGRAPTTIDAKQHKYDNSMLDKLGARGVADAKDVRSQAEDGFFKEQQLGAMDKANRKDESRNDPNSAESQAARAFLKSVLPSAAKNPAIDKMSYEQITQAAPMLMKKWESDRAQGNSDRDYSLKQQELNAKGKKPLGEGQQKTVNYASAALTGVADMRAALKGGNNTFSLVGDNDFTEAARRAAESYGRLQSGGAINKDEEARFMKMLPGVTDSAEMQERKLAKMEAEMRARIGSEGVNADDQLRIRGTEVASAGKAAPHGQTVRQGGVTFTWNGQEYVPQE